MQHTALACHVRNNTYCSIAYFQLQVDDQAGHLEGRAKGVWLPETLITLPSEQPYVLEPSTHAYALESSRIPSPVQFG